MLKILIKQLTQVQYTVFSYNNLMIWRNIY